MQLNLPNITTTLDPVTDNSASWTKVGTTKYQHSPAPMNTDEDDDKSVQASNKTNLNSTLSDKRDIYIKLTAWPKTNQEADQVTNNFSNILKAISNSNEASELEIFDNNGTRRNAQQWLNAVQFLRQFKIYRSKTARHYKRRQSFWMTIRIRTRTSIRTIKRHEAVAKLLDAYNTQMKFSDWSDSEEDSNITALGFIIRYDPRNCPTKQVIREINGNIKEATGTPLSEIPRWKPAMTSTTVQHNGKTHRNLSYDLTCRTSDNRALRALLHDTFTSPQYQNLPRYSPYELKRKKPEIFARLVDYQSDYCASMYTIAVEGIPIEHMYNGFLDELKAIQPNIVDIYEHQNTEKENSDGEPIGRWNIMTKVETFNSLAKTLRDNLQTYYENFVNNTNQQPVRNIRFNPRVTSKITYQEVDDDDETQTTRDSFVTFYENSSIASYTKEAPEDDGYIPDDPTAFGAPPPTNIGISNATATYSQILRSPTPMSEMTEQRTEITSFREEFEQLKVTSANQAQQINELIILLKASNERPQPAPTPLPPPPPPPQTSNHDQYVNPQMIQDLNDKLDKLATIVANNSVNTNTNQNAVPKPPPLPEIVTTTITERDNHSINSNTTPSRKPKRQCSKDSPSSNPVTNRFMR